MPLLHARRAYSHLRIRTHDDAEFRGWDKDNQKALLGMVETNFLGMPDTMKTQLLTRLKQKT